MQEAQASGSNEERTKTKIRFVGKKLAIKLRMRPARSIVPYLLGLVTPYLKQNTNKENNVHLQIYKKKYDKIGIVM